ncbi:MAG: hypothetical protein WBF62_00035, partial [Bradyrhizobium sp.]
DRLVADFDGTLGALENRRMVDFPIPARRSRKPFASAPMIGCGRVAPRLLKCHAAVDPNAIDGRIFEYFRSSGAIRRPFAL